MHVIEGTDLYEQSDEKYCIFYQFITEVDVEYVVPIVDEFQFLTCILCEMEEEYMKQVYDETAPLNDMILGGFLEDELVGVVPEEKEDVEKEKYLD